MSDDARILVIKNGPLKVPADMLLVRCSPGDRAAGQTWVEDALDMSGKAAGGIVTLCRCGHSADKPFCDGSHRREGFQDG